MDLARTTIINAVNFLALMVSSNDEVLGSPARVSVNLGESFSLQCRSAESQQLQNARLVWLDGKVPITHSVDNRVLERNGSTVTLHFHNFTLENYGRYQCKCFVDYTDTLLVPQDRHVHWDGAQSEFGFYINSLQLSNQSFCSMGDYNVDLLPENHSAMEVMEEHFVNETVWNLQFSCESDQWIIWRPQSSPQDLLGQELLNVSITTSKDQAKLICLAPDRSSLDRIIYVSIEDYSQIPLSFLRPHRNGDDIAVNVSTDSWPVLCGRAPNIPYHTNLSLLVNGTELASEGFQTHNSDQWLILITVNNAAKKGKFYRESHFSCRLNSIWEEDAIVHFRIVDPISE